MSRHSNSLEPTTPVSEAGDEEDNDRAAAMEQDEEDREDEDVNEAAGNDEVKTNDPRDYPRR